MTTEKSVATVKSNKERPKPQPAARPSGNGPTQRMGKYLSEVRTELRKTIWPTKPELIAQTQVVLGVLLLLGVFIACWDVVLGYLFRGLLQLMGVRQ